MTQPILKGNLIEADFENNHLIFQMEPGYYAVAGPWLLIPANEWPQIVERYIAAKEKP
jgi:hypothetical protein